LTADDGHSGAAQIPDNPILIEKQQQVSGIYQPMFFSLHGNIWVRWF
jgi:hypothetical protein